MLHKTGGLAPPPFFFGDVIFCTRAPASLRPQAKDYFYLSLLPPPPLQTGQTESRMWHLHLQQPVPLFSSPHLPLLPLISLGFSGQALVSREEEPCPEPPLCLTALLNATKAPSDSQPTEILQPETSTANRDPQGFPGRLQKPKKAGYQTTSSTPKGRLSLRGYPS